MKHKRDDALEIIKNLKEKAFKNNEEPFHLNRP